MFDVFLFTYVQGTQMLNNKAIEDIRMKKNKGNQRLFASFRRKN